MKQVLNLYRENINYIENSFKFDINNGIIEGNNNQFSSTIISIMTKHLSSKYILYFTATF